MLKDANASGTAAPASLNGNLPRPDPEEGWIDRHRKSQEMSRPDISSSTDSEKLPSPSTAFPRRFVDSSASTLSVQTSVRSNTPDSLTPPTSQSNSQPADPHRHRSSTLYLSPAPAKPVIAKDTLTVSSRGASSLQAGSTNGHMSASLVLANTVHARPTAARLTVSSLLEQLTDLHDQQQKERMARMGFVLEKEKGETI